MLTIYTCDRRPSYRSVSSSADHQIVSLPLFPQRLSVLVQLDYWPLTKHKPKSSGNVDKKEEDARRSALYRENDEPFTLWETMPF